MSFRDNLFQLHHSTLKPSMESSPLNRVEAVPQTASNRLFAAAYSFAILSLFYYHTTNILNSTTLLSFSVRITLFVSDLVLAFLWVAAQAMRMYPVYRQEFPENLEKTIKRDGFPALDIFICTADPFMEPPIRVVNTVLSVMAYDYPREKLSIYVSDDGGSVLTLFALMEAAKFAIHWLPFCKENNVLDRNPQAFFQSKDRLMISSSDQTLQIQMMYKNMKDKVDHVLQRGRIDDQFISRDQECEIFNQWNDEFTLQEHPSVIQVLLDSGEDKDITGHSLPNLIYISREKSKSSPHHFKAGALNVLLRVSATMTNAPIILTLDCDCYSNDAKTPLRALCYMCDPAIQSTLAFILFPQLFPGMNKDDIYAGEHKRLYQMHGADGLMGPFYLGTGCFFRRRALFGGPSTPVLPEKPELDPNHVVDKPLHSLSRSEFTHQVASCAYESNYPSWGYKIGFRYGSLVEDYLTGFQLHNEGWRSVFCRPKRAAFHGDTPINLVDVLDQQKRWSIGLLEVCFSKHSPIVFGVKALGPLMGLCYTNLAFWSSWSVPATVYALLPQLALINKVYIFPKVSEAWFFLYVFLFLGAYVQDFVEFMLVGGTIKKWWNDQRFWLVRGLTCYLFGSVEFLLKILSISASVFNVTSKVVDDEQRRRYEQGMFEFGVHSPMFVMLTLVAMINLVSFVQGVWYIFTGNNSVLDGLFLQMCIAGFGVVNCWPIYEAIAFRSDDGRMPIKTIVLAALLSCIFYLASAAVFS